MVTLSKRQCGIGNLMEKYQLNLARLNSEKELIGVVICYLIATDKDTKFRSLYAENDSDSSDYIFLGQFGNEELLSDIYSFSGLFISKGITKWHLTCLVRGCEVGFYGHSYGTFVGISIPEGGDDINLMPLLRRVENLTHSFE